MATDTYICTGD